MCLCLCSVLSHKYCSIFSFSISSLYFHEVKCISLQSNKESQHMTVKKNAPLNPKSSEKQTLCSPQRRFYTSPEAQGSAHSLSLPELVVSSSCLLFSANSICLTAPVFFQLAKQKNTLFALIFALKTLSLVCGINTFERCRSVTELVKLRPSSWLAVTPSSHGPNDL